MDAHTELSRSDWRRLFDLLDAAIEMDPVARERWLAGLEGEPGDLRSKLLVLIEQRVQQQGGAAYAMAGSAPGRPADPDRTAARRSAPDEPGAQEPGTWLRVDGDVGGAAFAGVSVGAVLSGRFELVEELGRGGMGQVFKARDLVIAKFERNPIIALKLLSDEFRRHPDSLIALQRETKRARSLAHPNVVTVHEFNEDGAHAYMTMEYLEGATLDVLLRSRFAGGISLEQAWPIINGVGSALQYGHEKGIVHSDLKPGNIFVCHDGTVKVLDFGISRPMPATGTRSEETLFDPGKRLGGLTPAYASLEMWNREPPDPRDDIYAFACVVYELLAGRHPFGQATARQVLEGNLEPNRIERLTRRQWEALRRGLALRRADRTPSVPVFLRPFAPASFLRRHPIAVGSAAAVVVAGMLAVSAVYFRSYVEDTVFDEITMPQAAQQRRNLTAEERKQVADSLWLAGDYLGEVRRDMPVEDMAYVLSDGVNAVTPILDSVLQVDPGNEQALDMQRRVIGFYEARARRALESGATADALFLVRHGLAVRTNHRSLLKLQREICDTDARVCTEAAAAPAQN